VTDPLQPPGRTRTRALAPRVWATRSSDDGRIATHPRCHLDNRRRSTTRPGNLSRCVTQPASLRCALASAAAPGARGRARTRALATRVWAHSLVCRPPYHDHARCHLHDRPTTHHPAWESISLKARPVSLRCALPCTAAPGSSNLLNRSSASRAGLRSAARRDAQKGRPPVTRATTPCDAQRGRP
jgi:hypothetical protein